MQPKWFKSVTTIPARYLKRRETSKKHTKTKEV